MQHLDGRFVEVSRTEVTKPFQTIVLEEEGMPVHEVPSQFGDMHVTFEVQFPSSLSKAQILALKEAL